MNARHLLIAAALFAASTAGCNVVKSLVHDKEQADKEQAAASAAAVAPPPSVAVAPPAAPPPPDPAYAAAAAPSAAPAAGGDDGIPTSTDFEEEAFQLVTKDSVKVRVDDLSREIKGQ
jgi:hypothetical protein